MKSDVLARSCMRSYCKTLYIRIYPNGLGFKHFSVLSLKYDVLKGPAESLMGR